MTGEKAHILVVEDEAAHAELIGRAFQERAKSMSLTVTGSLRDARTSMVESVPDLVIADLLLPDGQGIEILPAEGQDSHFPVVMMTSHGNEQMAVEAIKAGALHYVVKSETTLAEMPRIAERALREWRQLLEHRRAEEALRDSEQRYRTLYDNTPSMFLTVDRSGRVLSANRFAAEQLGYDVDELVGMPLARIHAEEDRGALRSYLEECFEQPEELHRWETRKLHKERGAIWVRVTARVTRSREHEPSVLLVCEDFTETRRLSDQLSYQATHDSLTGLVNRREFERRLERLLREARVKQAKHALCYCDLDQFKVINDTYGHVAGDELLRQIGGLLKQQVRKRDTLARLGGDEFGILIGHCAPGDALRIADVIRKTVEEFRFFWQGKSFSIGLSIGLVAIDENSTSSSDLLAAADAACYTAKDQGRNRVYVHTVDDAEREQRHGEMQWVARIRDALENNRFQFAYQRIAAVGNGNGNGNGNGDHYELLLRMVDENRRLVMPDVFLPAAERYDLLGEIDRWVVDAACRWLVRHRDTLQTLRLCSVNLSGHSLGNREFLEYVLRRLDQPEVPAERLCFEITETGAIANLASATRFIEALREKGCRFALDDFGSGLSSFAYLRSLSVDFIKIDQMFIKDIVEDPADLAVVKSINEIGHAMGKQTIAESVENEQILEKLREIGIDYAQGYHIDPPRPWRSPPDATGDRDPHRPP